MRLLVVAAHVDDEALLCGGTLHKARRQGHETTVIFCSRNEQGRTAAETVEARRRRAESEAAASSALLGFTSCFLPFEDMRLADEPGRLQKALIAAIREVQPSLIISHSPGDWHSDHRAVASAVTEAALQSRYALAGSDATWRPAAVLQGEVDLEGLAPFSPQALSRLEAADLDARLAAVEGYRSLTGDHGVEMGALRRSLEARAAHRGRLAGFTAAEAFAISPLIALDAAALRTLAEVLA